MMMLRSLLLAFLGTITIESPSMAVAPPDTTTRSLALTGGNWFDGKSFHPATFYVVAGRLTATKPAHIDEVVDLAGGYVVPPFGEAHNHNVEGEWNADEVIGRYLRDGVFHVKITNSIPDFTARIQKRINTPTSIDVSFANGGLTGTGGHPIPLYEDTLAKSRYAHALGKVKPGWFEGRAYHVVDSEEDFSRKWPTIKAAKPDFLKVYLVHSEDPVHAAGASRWGLDPKLLPPIVAAAHRDGLRVTAHVETAVDFHNAVVAGVDEVAHLPGWNAHTPEEARHGRITQEDARLASQNRVGVMTTTVAGPLMSNATHGHGHDHGHAPHGDAGHATKEPPPVADHVRETWIENLRLLGRHGVQIIIGSDHAETSLAEALQLHRLGVFDNATLLRMWCETTPQSIFPGRKIGRLEEGYERASWFSMAIRSRISTPFARFGCDSNRARH